VFKQKRLLILAATSWWMLWAIVQVVVMTHYKIPLRESVIDAAFTAALLALAGFDIAMMVKYFRPSPKHVFYVLAASAVLAVLACLALGWIVRQFPMDGHYLDKLDTIMWLRFVFMWLMTLIVGAQGWVWWYVNEQKEIEQRAKETDQLMREAELANLRQQLQPHFLFNSLNSISALTIAQPEQARKMIEQLSDFLRGTVKKDSHQLIPLRDELHHLQLYLDIEKVRFGHRLIATIEADKTVLGLKLPSLLLQPVLENAIKFGLYDITGDVTITVEAKAIQNNLVIEIKNPFDPETAHPKSGTGFGLSSVQRRLLLMFHRNDLFSVEKKNNVFIARIRIPQDSIKTSGN
jgi:hypothetical protein